MSPSNTLISTGYTVRYRYLQNKAARISAFSLFGTVEYSFCVYSGVAQLFKSTFSTRILKYESSHIHPPGFTTCDKARIHPEVHHVYFVFGVTTQKWNRRSVRASYASYLFQLTIVFRCPGVGLGRSALILLIIVVTESDYDAKYRVHRHDPSEV